MRRWTIGVVAAASLFAASAGARGEPAVETSGCLTGAGSNLSGNVLSISWSLVGHPNSGGILFNPDGLYFDNIDSRPLTSQQIAGYASIMDDLRAAATARKQVNVYWERSTKKIQRIEVIWSLGC